MICGGAPVDQSGPGDGERAQRAAAGVEQILELVGLAEGAAVVFQK